MGCLCGKDLYTGNCYEHHRKIIVERIKFLASVFNVDVCAYAIMSNPYHLVLKINSTKEWSEKQVLACWSELCELPTLCDRYMTSDTFSKAELDLVYLQTDVYRKRLMSISWFMRLLNEYISRIANAEENLSGTFYDLLPCKSLFVLPTAFKFDPVKFSGNLALKAKHCLMKEHF